MEVFQIMLYEIMDKDVYTDFIYDVKNGKVQNWVKKYPKYISAIFLNYCLIIEKIKKDDLIFFINEGIDINSTGNYCYDNIEATFYYNTRNLLLFACEKRDFEILKYLFSIGVRGKVKIEILLKSIILGESFKNKPSEENLESILESIKIILQNSNLFCKQSKEEYDLFYKKIKECYLPTNKYIEEIINQIKTMI